MGVVEHLVPTLVKLAYTFERFFPRFIKFYLDRKLKEYVKRGVITSFKVTARRKGKYHYSFQVDLLLDEVDGGEKHG